MTTPSGNVKSARLITTRINTGPDGDCDPTRPIFDIVAGSDNQSIGKQEKQETRKKTDDCVPTFTALNTSSQRFAGLVSSAVAATRLVYFNEKEDPEQIFYGRGRAAGSSVRSECASRDFCNTRNF